MTTGSEISAGKSFAGVAGTDGSSGFNYLLGGTGDGGVRTDGTSQWSTSQKTNGQSFEAGGSQYIDSVEITADIAATTTRLIFLNSDADGFSIKLSKIGGTYVNRHWSGTIQEMICWTTDASANRTSIESEINAHYSIY